MKPKTGWKSTNNYDALLVTTDGSKNTFSSVATDGDTVVIGAADSNNESDVAYVYVKSKGGWGHLPSGGRIQTANGQADKLGFDFRRRVRKLRRHQRRYCSRRSTLHRG